MARPIEKAVAKLPDFHAIVVKRLGIEPDTPPARFWSLVNAHKTTHTTAKDICDLYGMRFTTFNSKFERAGVPTAKEVLSEMRLICIGFLLADGHSVTEVAAAMRCSAPQSLARMMREMRGFSPTKYAETFVLKEEIERFCTIVIDPHAVAWRTFAPSAPTTAQASDTTTVEVTP